MSKPDTDRVGVITVTVPDDVGLALKLYGAIGIFVGREIPDFDGVVSLHFEDEGVSP